VLLRPLVGFKLLCSTWFSGIHHWGLGVGLVGQGLGQLLGLLDHGDRNRAEGATVPRTVGGDVGGVVMIMGDLEATNMEIINH